MIKITGKTKNVLKRDSKVIFTTTREDFPLVVDRGDGDYVWDIEGNKFIDFTTFISVYNLGVNANAQVRRAAKEQIDKLMHPAFLDFYAELPVRFAENLMTMMPRGFGRVFYSNSGTEANEDAIKLSKLFTKRPYVLAFYGAFHGRTIGSLSLTSSKVSNRLGLGPFPNVVHALYPYPYRCPFGTDDPEECVKMCIDHIERNIFGREYSSKEIGSIFFEPIQGEGGYVIPPKSFFKELRRIADEHGILLVADEVQSGYMRTGKFLALDNFGVTADIYTMAKSIAAGMPLGVTTAKLSLGDTPAGSHAGTFGGNLVSVAAAQASLTYVKRNYRSLQKQVHTKGRYIMKRLESMREKYEIVGDVRGIGLMIALELVRNKKTKEPGVKERAAVIDECYHNNLILLPSGASVIRIIPPLTMGQNNIERGMNVLEDAVAKVNAEATRKK